MLGHYDSSRLDLVALSLCSRSRSSHPYLQSPAAVPALPVGLAKVHFVAIMTEANPQSVL